MPHGSYSAMAAPSRVANKTRFFSSGRLRQLGKWNFHGAAVAYDKRAVRLSNVDAVYRKARFPARFRGACAARFTLRRATTQETESNIANADKTTAKRAFFQRICFSCILVNPSCFQTSQSCGRFY
jgi:hypothetical protein